MGYSKNHKKAEKIIAEYILHDMKVNLDTSQYANQPGVSAQHYLKKMVDRILKDDYEDEQLLDNFENAIIENFSK